MNELDVKDVLSRYMDGKDNIKPDVLQTSFSVDGIVTFEINTPNISFPDEIVGNRRISEVMFGDFHELFGQVKSYYLDQDFSLLNACKVVNQHWLVSMREKATGNTRVGSGTYNWLFEKKNQRWTIKRVHIVIDHMVSFEDNSGWLDRLQSELSDYPWAEKPTMMGLISSQPELGNILEYLKR